MKLRDYILNEYPGMFREAGGRIPHPFLTPGSAQYDDVLWDWDSWLANVALRQVLMESADAEASRKAREYERGCILNWLHFAKPSGCAGWVPILVGRGGAEPPPDPYRVNMHKPCLAQHAAFLVREADGDAEWLRDDIMYLQYFLNNYRNHHRHECGLYFWQTDHAIGVDNDPCTFGRPDRSSGSIFLNCMMHRELTAMAWLLEKLGLDEAARESAKDAENLKSAIQEHCWDPRDGFFYSVDLNLTKPGESHFGAPRSWPCLIQRIGVWSGFLALWSGIATPAQAERIVGEHYRNPESYHAPFGVRTLDRREKMYSVRATGNPSSWLGPVWGVSNYLVFRGLLKYGFEDDARGLAEKTIRLFSQDIERHGALHEYYQPENGMPVLNRGFQNWNFLVLNMMAWLDGRPVVSEF